MSNIFWDYQTIDTTQKSGIIVSLNRKIMFGVFGADDMDDIRKYLDELDMTDYWRYYFSLYFKKYGTHSHTDTVPELAR